MTRSADIYSLGNDGVAPEIRMLRLASGHVAAQAIHAFAYLRLADVLSAGAMTIAELAARSATDADALYRLLRFLGTIEVVKEHEDRRFELTALGRTLCSKPTSVIRDNTLLMGSRCYWGGIGGLLRQVQSGENAFEQEFGTSFFSYLAANDEESAIFSSAMNSSSRLGLSAVLSAYDFSASRTVVDVGGGRGAMLQGILRKQPAAYGILYDDSTVLQGALTDPATESRLTKVPGSFFDSVPSGGDTYILRRILHDWNDSKAVQILRNCRRAMSQDSRLLVIELAQADSPNNWAGLDLLMMVMMDGRERTEADLRQILCAADLKLQRTMPTISPYLIFEATPLE